MVLRVPRAVNDKLLLEDEPFKSYFARRRLAGEGRGQRRSPMYVAIEKSMRDTVGGLDAVTAWLGTVLGPNASASSQNIDAFIEFYWLLSFESDVLRVESRIRKLCKENNHDYFCQLSTPIGGCLEKPVVQKKKTRRSKTKKRSKQTQPVTYDANAENEENGSWMGFAAPEQEDGTSPPQLIAAPLSLSSQLVEPTSVLPYQNKRKAVASEPSSSDDSANIDNCSLSPCFSCIDSDTMTPLPSEYGEIQDLQATVLSDIEPLTLLPFDTEEKSPVAFPSTHRRNPPRKAARPQQLSEMMKREFQFHKEAAKLRRKTIPASDNEAGSQHPPVNNAPAATSPPMNLALSSLPVKRSVPPRRSISAYRETRRSQIFSKKKHAVADVVSRPAKKVKSKFTELARLTAEARWAGATLDDDGATKRTRSRTTVVCIVPPAVPVTAPAPLQISKELSQKTSGKKRARENIEPVSASLLIRIPPLKKSSRKTVPIPKKAKKRSFKQGLSMPPVPQNTLGDSASAVHEIIRDSAAHAMIMLRDNDEGVEEWEVESPSAQFAYAESDIEDEEVSHSHWLAPMEEEPEERVYFPRIPLPRYPPIWSQSRQEVCESFNKFRSYQGGVYFRKDLVEGYLLGGFSSRRDIFHNGGKLIISHGGGKAESIRKTDGHFQTHEARDQLQNDKSVRALLRTYQQREPVALLIDDKYALFPFDLTSKGCAYAVLGWYYIAHAWAEYQSAINAQGRVVRYKFAFQWADGQGEPWWNTYLGALEDESNHAEETESPESPSDKYELCQTCRKSSPQVYEQGWMCLKPECERFWTLSDGKPAPVTLSYAQSFLEPRTGFRKHTEDIRPPLPVRSDEITGPTTSWHFCKGWHCTNCGRLSSRFKWEHWECRTCGEQYTIPAKLREPEEFRRHTHAKTFDRHYVLPGSNIICGGYRNFKCDMGYASHCTFILPYNRGRIHLLLTNPLSTQDADKILTEYQEQSISGQLKFRRWPLRAHKCRGILLTNYFSQNTGEPYQYVGGTDNTVSWDAAPSAVVHALDLIKRRIEQAELPCRADFNEVLSAAYMEKQKMAFHSDAERGLGPNVASLSLGGSAYMYFRLHSRFAATELSPGSSRDVLQFYLRHGDVLVMEGADVQNHYEHTVVPTNFRVAATARYIGSEHR